MQLPRLLSVVQVLNLLDTNFCVTAIPQVFQDRSMWVVCNLRNTSILKKARIKIPLRPLDGVLLRPIDGVIQHG